MPPKSSEEQKEQEQKEQIDRERLELIKNLNYAQKNIAPIYFAKIIDLILNAPDSWIVS